MTRVLRSWTQHLDAALCIAALVVVLCVGFNAGDHMPIAHGLGWDGEILGNTSASWSKWVLGGKLSAYQMARIGPGSCVAAALAWVPVTTTKGVIVAWFALDVAALVVAALAWFGIARTLSLSRASAVLGFVALFANFATLKMTAYAPVLTDTAGLALTVVLLHFWLRDQRAGVFAVALLAAFTWPTTMAAALWLFVVPHGTLTTSPSTSSPRVRIANGLAVAVALGMSAWLLLADHMLHGRLLPTADATWHAWLPLSVLVSAAFVALAARPLLHALLNVEVHALHTFVTSSATWARLALSVALVVAARLVCQHFAGKPPNTDLDGMVHRLVYESVGKPLVFVVAHTVYLGPALLLALWLWPRVTSLMARQGSGLMVLVLGLLLLTLASESRTVLTVVPFLVAFTAQATSELLWSARRVAVFTVTSLLLSRAWSAIPAGPLTGPPTSEPAQRYFMNFGPWMNTHSYGGWLVVTAAVALVIVALVYLRPRAPAVDA